MAFLDAHVAFGHDDHEYADFVVDRLWAHVQKAEDDVASIVHALANCGGADGPEQQAALTTLLENLARDLPCWHKGGYSIAEMAAAESR